MEPKLIMYMHAGSGNHGCEAIVKSVLSMVKEEVLLISYFADEDRTYSLKGVCEIIQERSFQNHRLAHLAYYGYRMLSKDRESFIRYRYGKAFGKKRAPLAISIGGDNYCYDNMLNDLMLANSAFNKIGTRTLLLGCSIEPELLKKEEIKKDLLRYHTIIARESITYEALCNMLKELDGGALQKPRLYCFPDPAFTLSPKLCALPEGFQEGNTIGINISPMIQDNEEIQGLAFHCYETLIQYLVEHTDLQIALIPHVVWDRNDDRKPAGALYEKFKETGRVVKIKDGTCEELKGFISRCRFFIGARTHATIAAYSSCVPTLVVGYSVKARGIALDLFGTHEQYVIPVQSLKAPGDLKEGFLWLLREEDQIRQHLKKIMPSYKEKALQTGKEVDSLWEELNQPQEI